MTNNYTTVTKEITQDLSCFVEEKYYKYNNLLNLVRFLNTSDLEQTPKYLSRYEDELQKSFNELEIAKTQVISKAIPEALRDKKYTYRFDFSNSCIDFFLEESMGN